MKKLKLKKTEPSVGTKLSDKKNKDNREGERELPLVGRLSARPTKSANPELYQALNTIKEVSNIDMFGTIFQDIYLDLSTHKLSYDRNRLNVYSFGVNIYKGSIGWPIASTKVDFVKRSISQIQRIFFSILKDNVAMAKEPLKRHTRFIGSLKDDFFIPVSILESSSVTAEFIDSVLPELKNSKSMIDWLPYFQYLYIKKRDGILTTNIFKMASGDNDEEEVEDNSIKKKEEWKAGELNIDTTPYLTEEHTLQTVSDGIDNTEMYLRFFSGRDYAPIKQDIFGLYQSQRDVYDRIKNFAINNPDRVPTKMMIAILRAPIELNSSNDYIIRNTIRTMIAEDRFSESTIQGLSRYNLVRLYEECNESSPVYISHVIKTRAVELLNR